MEKSLALQLIEQNLKTKDPYLDLGRCGLDGTEPELELLGTCDHLETLVFSNGWGELDEKGDWVTSESVNKGRRNLFTQLPLQLPKHLKNLICRGFYNRWEIQDLTPIEKLNQLTTLYCNYNQITDLKPIEKLYQLTDLDCRDNQIDDLNPIEKLNKLTILDCGSNQVNDLKPIEKLNQLTQLYCSYNQIRTLKPIEKLNLLTRLAFRDNQIDDLKPIEKLNLLTTLKCSNNQIQQVPVDFFQALPKLSILYLHNNPIQNIPQEIFDKEHDVLREVKDYLNSIATNESQQALNEAKLVIGGVGEVGKSELTDALSLPDYQFAPNRTSTHGIRIKEWRFAIEQAGKEADFRANVWDLAGQKENYNTHQFFLSKNTLYVFVWEARKGIEQANQFDYWLEVITLLSEKAPILVVRNKVDDGKDGEISQRHWKNKFPHIVGFYETSCKTQQGIEQLSQVIQTQLQAFEHTQSVWNKERLQVRETLENADEEYISIEEYLKIADKNALTEEQALFLSQQLHDLGIILHFSKDSLLRNTVILKSDWAIDAAYCLVDQQKVQQSRFDKKDLDAIWGESRFKYKHGFLLELMKKFELIFQFQNGNTYIVPEGLPIDASFSADDEATLPSLRFEYHYDFMPQGILSRFICRIHHYIKDDRFWRHGVILEYEGSTQAEIVSNEVAKKITIRLWGEEAATLLAIIRSEINYIHKTLKNPPLQEVIPCYCDNCQTKESDFFEYSYLKMCLEEGDETIRCRNRTRASIEQLLKGILEPDYAKLQEFIHLIEENRLDDCFAKIDALTRVIAFYIDYVQSVYY